MSDCKLNALNTGVNVKNNEKLNKNQVSFGNNPYAQFENKTPAVQKDSFVKSHKKEIIAASAVVGSLATLGVTAWAYVRGKRVNNALGVNSGVFSNITKGFKSFFGKGKQEYNLFKQVGFGSPLEKYTKKGIEDIPVEKTEIPAGKIDIPVEKADIPVEKTEIPAEKMDTPEVEVKKPAKNDPFDLGADSAAKTIKTAQIELDGTLESVKKAGYCDNDFKAKSLDELKAGLSNVEEIAGGGFSGRLPDGTYRTVGVRKGNITNIQECGHGKTTTIYFDENSKVKCYDVSKTKDDGMLDAWGYIVSENGKIEALDIAHSRGAMRYEGFKTY